MPLVLIKKLPAFSSLTRQRFPIATFPACLNCQVSREQIYPQVFTTATSFDLDILCKFTSPQIALQAEGRGTVTEVKQFAHL